MLVHEISLWRRNKDKSTSKSKSRPKESLFDNEARVIGNEYEGATKHEELTDNLSHDSNEDGNCADSCEGNSELVHA